MSDDWTMAPPESPALAAYREDRVNDAVETIRLEATTEQLFGALDNLLETLVVRGVVGEPGSESDDTIATVRERLQVLTLQAK